jgi:hypothetical protein
MVTHASGVTAATGRTTWIRPSAYFTMLNRGPPVALKVDARCSTSSPLTPANNCLAPGP